MMEETIDRLYQRFREGILAVDEVTRLAQWALTLLTPAEYHALLAGTLEEEAIVGPSYAGPGEYIGYISTTTLRPEFRRRRFLRSLLDSPLLRRCDNGHAFSGVGFSSDPGGVA